MNAKGDNMISQRQEKLLKLIVEEYIKTARPVSSKAICKALDCSSATVRSEMGILEDLGLIEKTHISSGRIPSEKGYRYYVANIMKPKELSGDDMLKLQTIFHNNALALNDVIKKSMEIISEITNYTAIVLGTSSKDNRLSKVEAVPLDENKIIALVITDKGHVEHKNIYLEEKVSLLEIKQTVDLINKLVVGTPINEVSHKLEFEIKPIIAKYVKQHEVLYNAFYNAFNDFANEANIKMSGTSQFLKQPEFNSLEKIRKIIDKFEDREMINSIREEKNGINIYIGSESAFDEDVAIIKTKYEVNGEEGTIAIIGPKRMEYDRVIPLLEYIKQNIER